MGKINDFFIRHPLIKGMAAYGILWPSANIIHQMRTKNRQKLDFFAVATYGMVGVTFVCPVFYAWLKTINRLIPGTNFTACFKKVIWEQTLYWPVAIAVFFGGMNFYEGNSFEHFKAEFKEKYFQTHMTGLMFWPFISPFINYSNLVKDHNRAPIGAMASFLWASFLSYVKELETKHYIPNENIIPEHTPPPVR